MDIYATSFCYPRRTATTSYSAPASLDFTSSADSYANAHHTNSIFTVPVIIKAEASQGDVEIVQRNVMAAMQAHGCLVTYTKAERDNGWNFHITGAYQQVMATRGMILRDTPSQHRSVMKVTRSEILDVQGANPIVKSDVRRKLDDVANQTSTRVAVVNSPLSLTLAPPDAIASDGGWSGLETERVCELAVTGNSVDRVDVGRVRLLVMLDEMSGLHSEVCEIDHKLHAIIAGRRRGVVQSIQEETATNIYFPSPLQGLVGPEVGPVGAAPPPSTASARQSNNVIWITGEFFGVQRARDMLFQYSIQKANAVISRDTAILPRKLDWMLTDHMDDLKATMNDNATFIHFPPIGSSTSLITVYGDHKVNIQRTIRSVMQLACQFYVGSLYLLPMQFNPLLPPPTLNPAQMTVILKQISNASGAEVVFKSMRFEMHGLEHEVRLAMAMVLELDIIKNFQHEIRFQIELANEHREFISGKKNGKINKIMQTTNVKIKFETFNDHNFLIDIAGNDAGAIQGLTLLQEELPAEISFHVPESYHKRIIGVGGKSIQRIMKKYGVYVKFSNAEEFASLGGYSDNEDNVIARTPAKNAMNLDNLKQAVMELVNPKDKDFITEKVTIPRKYHRTLLGEKSIFIHDIESKTNCRIRFPDKETASDIIAIFGPESQVNIAATMLLDHVPFEASMSVPPNAELARICVSPEFVAFAERVKRDYQVSVVPSIVAPTDSSSPSTTPGECSFKFTCQRSNSDFLTAARELLEQFLMSHNVQVYPSSKTHKRADSFAEAFPHFDSKLLSAATAHDMSTMSRAADASADRRLRLASSSPDVKALFNNSPSAYSYSLEEDEVAGYDQMAANDYWSPMPFLSANTPIAQTRQSEDAAKRGSDSLLESKLREKYLKPRSIQNRAQSLDLTFSLSRITERPPDSPTNSTGEGEGSTPPSATAPSFPSVYGPPSVSVSGAPKQGSMHSASRAARILDDESVAEVSRVIANLGL
ncbi:hypothetical protein BD410DRAFT_712143 [Rickenella mellea]|uniref:K Homology domain-containing protein n=1 Tax=Rickenella mellea TaxID=50990 RepID=A0A4Y7QNC2_9AGAM|nr:hypothetical protein BD410DRAFT_712143 [Rickenella mellea]